MDGNIYITKDEVARTKQIYAEFGPAVVHHFTGSWGDGSSGRVSVWAEHYKVHGYRNELFPRKFDEISLMMNVLRSEPGVQYFCRAEADIFSISWFLRSFQEKENCQPIKSVVDIGADRAPRSEEHTSELQS